MKLDLFNEDCVEVMARYEDNWFDIAIVDPPYGIGTHCIKNNKNRTKLAQAKEYKLYKNEKCYRPSPEYFQELRRVSRNQIVWGANHLADLFNAAGSGWIVWNKQATASFSDCELAYTSFKCSAKLYTYRWNGMLQGEHGDKRKNEVRIHPSQKPVAIYSRILTDFSTQGDRILDTHLGSASSAIAAHYFGVREFVGCEIDSDYFNLARERIEHETAQKDIFESEQ